MNHLVSDPAELAQLLKKLHATRRDKVASNRRPRSHLSAADREAIFTKAGGRCHICGGLIDTAWDADHVQSHSTGGRHSLDNYLPAHATCNQYRWNFTPEEFAYILKLGVWLRTQIERRTLIGRSVARAFLCHERVRTSRRKRAAAPEP